jgi:hypothetical protein
MINIQEDLSAELKEYLNGNNHSMQISRKEAEERGGIPIFRDFTFEMNELRFFDDKYSLFGDCSLKVEQAFSGLFFENQIVAFTPYTVSKLPIAFGLSFRIETLVVQAKQREWF